MILYYVRVFVADDVCAMHITTAKINTSCLCLEITSKITTDYHHHSLPFLSPNTKIGWYFIISIYYVFHNRKLISAGSVSIIILLLTLCTVPESRWQDISSVIH